MPYAFTFAIGKEENGYSSVPTKVEPVFDGFGVGPVCVWNAWYLYIASMIVSKNLPDQYVSYNVIQMLIFVGYHKMRFFSYTQVIIWVNIIFILP